MTLAWLREAALVAAHAHQELEGSTKDNVKPTRLDLSSQKQFSHISWQRIDDIGGGLYICGAAALDNKAELSRLGVGCILNCGGEDIYTRSYNCAVGTPLSKRLQGFQVEVLDAEDVEQQDMRAAWQKAASIIDQALRRGDGVVVHCAQGVSRSSSTCIAYLMMKENLPLEGAFRRVFQATWREPAGVRGSQLDSLIQLGRPWNVWMQSLQKGGVTWQLDGSETMLWPRPSWHDKVQLQGKAAEQRDRHALVNVVYKHNWYRSTIANTFRPELARNRSGRVALIGTEASAGCTGNSEFGWAHTLAIGAWRPRCLHGFVVVLAWTIFLVVLTYRFPAIWTLQGPPRLVVRDELGEELVLEGDDRGPTADWVAEWLPERPGPYEVFVLYPGVGENEEFAETEMLDVAAPTWQLVAAWRLNAQFRVGGEAGRGQFVFWQEPAFTFLRSQVDVASRGSTSRVALSPDRSMGVVISDVFLEEERVVQLTVLSRLAGPIERWPETLAPQAPAWVLGHKFDTDMIPFRLSCIVTAVRADMQHDELYSHILRRRGGLQAKASAEVQQSAGAAIRFPYTEGGLRSSRAAVYWAWLQLAIGQRLAAAATASNISVSDVLSDPSAAGIIRFAEKLGRPLSACEQAHLAAVPVSRSWLQEALQGCESGSCYALDDQARLFDGIELLWMWKRLLQSTIELFTVLIGRLDREMLIPRSWNPHRPTSLGGSAPWLLEHPESGYSALLHATERPSLSVAMVLETISLLFAAAGGAAYVKGSATVSDSLQVLVGWKKPKRRVACKDGDLPFVDAGSPAVRCFGPGRERCGEVRYLALFTDQLLLNATPGPPEETISIAGAEVTHQAAVLLVQLPEKAFSLWFEDAEEAEYWAESLGFAAGAAAPSEEEQLKLEGMHSSKVQELENRVAAALRAAYDRSARIKELEDTIESGKDREIRIQQLEEVLHDTLEEAEARAERIEALEWQLDSKDGVSDPVATALLQDAMDFADELLEQHSDMWTEDDSAAQLREAVQAVQKSKPGIDSEVAELIRQLVTALRWPVVLRERLADAEATVKEQEEIQEQALREIVDLQKKCDTLESESQEHQEALKRAQEQKALTDVEHEQELQRLKEREEEAEKKRHEAEEKAQELRELLDYADQAAEEAIRRKREELEKAHAEELSQLRQLTEVADAQQKEAHDKAVELHQKLQAAEAAIDAKAEKEKERLSAQHDEEIAGLKLQIASAEQQRDRAREQALNLNQQLEDSQVQTDELAQLREALEEAQRTSAFDKDALQQREQQERSYLEELEQLKRNREATDKRRAEAEGHLSELREMLASAQKRSDEAGETQKEQATRHAMEVRGLQTRCETAEVQEQLAEAKAQKLKERLVTELQAADEAGSKQQKQLEKEREKELEDVRQQQREAETDRKAADARAEELKKKLEEAERRAFEAAHHQKANVDAAKEEEICKLRQQMETAEEKADKTEAQASQLREKLAMAEVSLSEEAQRRIDLIEQERLRSLGTEANGKKTVDDAATRWKTTADQASERLAHRDFQSDFGDKDREIDKRLQSAQKFLQKSAEVPAGEGSNAAAAAEKASKAVEHAKLSRAMFQFHLSLSWIIEAWFSDELKTGEFFRVDEAASLQAWTAAEQTSDRIPHQECYEALRNSLLPTLGHKRSGAVIPGDVSRACCADLGSLKSHITSLQQDLGNHYAALEGDMLNSLRGAITYERLEMRKGPVGDGNMALVEPYFRRIKLTPSAAQRLGYDTDVVAHNGWVMASLSHIDWPATEDFAMPSWRMVYLRRQLCVWTDTVKLYYGSCREDAPFLWDFMTDYAVGMAKMFHAVRLDNAHSTPLHVSRHVLSRVREANPHCWVFAELFTGNFKTDLLYQRTLGINALIRE
ncbi:GDB1, partial [Symbiodinium microadriaticum]